MVRAVRGVGGGLGREICSYTPVSAKTEVDFHILILGFPRMGVPKTVGL